MQHGTGVRSAGARRARGYWDAGGQTDGGQTAWKRKLAASALSGVGRVLDIGCGDGASSLAGWIGVDGDTRAVARARSASGIVGVCADADGTLPFADGSFDAVVLFDVLEHVPDPVALVGEARRVLAPGGRVLVGLPNAAHLANRLGAVRGSTADFTDAAHRSGSPISDHLHRFSMASAGRFLAGAGLHVRRRWHWFPDGFHEGRWRALSPVARLLVDAGVVDRRPSLLAYCFVFEATPLTSERGRGGDGLASHAIPGTATWADDDPRYRGYLPTSAGVRLDHRVEVALDLVPIVSGGVVVDVGSGDGFVAALAGERAGAALAVAVDAGFPAPLAPPAAPAARVVADVGRRLPLKDGCADVVVSLEVIEHLLDPDALLEEVRRVLRPGGTLVLSTPRLDSFLVVASLLAGIQPPGIDSSIRARYGNTIGEGRPSGHLHLFTKRALREALSAHGFEVEAWREGRFSSSWRQARAGRPATARDLALEACFALYDLIPVRKDVLVVRARRGG